jgi:hypothetical protein
MNKKYNLYCLWILLAFLITSCAIQQDPETLTITATQPSPELATSQPIPIETVVVSTISPVTTWKDSRMIFVGETVPDGINMQPGQAFQKTWTLKNGGSLPWVEGYKLAIVTSDPAGEYLQSPEILPLPQEVKPGEDIQLSVDLIAPQRNGRYSVYYQLIDENGTPVSGGEIWVMITVGSIGSSSINNVSVTLTNFISDENTAMVSFCMTTPNRNYALDRAPSLLIDQQPVTLLDGGTVLPWGCYEFSYRVSAVELNQAQSISLYIQGSMRMSPPPGDPNIACELARINLMDQYSGLDFQCRFSMAGYYTNLKLPKGMNSEGAKQVITDAIEGAVYGPWILTIR